VFPHFCIATVPYKKEKNSGISIRAFRGTRVIRLIKEFKSFGACKPRGSAPGVSADKCWQYVLKDVDLSAVVLVLHGQLQDGKTSCPARHLRVL
jgi:hypothetical protein